jgi:hypothetical protein
LLATISVVFLGQLGHCDTQQQKCKSNWYKTDPDPDLITVTTRQLDKSNYQTDDTADQTHPDSNDANSVHFAFQHRKQSNFRRC